MCARSVAHRGSYEIASTRMERDRGLKFKLWVPSRGNNGQINAVRCQETLENSGKLLDAMQQSSKICCDKEQNMSLLTSVVEPSKPTRQDFSQVKVVAPLEKEVNKCNPGELYSKLFDEVEKLKGWKVKVDTDTIQKERKLQDNKRTIETQRKAIQELQFGNESLSIKLEEQISENEDLRNKNHATRNLCNIFKETFQWSAEKMNSFETEREEMHHLFLENSESIKKLLTAFESLHIRVEADQQEMLKVKQDLLEFVDLKEKLQQEHMMKDEEIAKLQTKLKDKKDELQKVLFDLSETQEHCKKIQNSTNQQLEHFRSLKAEKESLLQNLHTAEQRCKETQKQQETTAAALKQSEKEYEEMVQSKDLSIQELSRAKVQQAEKMGKLETTLQELKDSLTLEKQRARDLEDKLMTNCNEFAKKSKLLGDITVQAAKNDDLIKIFENELHIKSKTITSLKSKIDVFEERVKELVAELSKKTEEIEKFKKENEMVLAENGLLKEVGETAEKTKEDLEEKFTFTELKVQKLEEQFSAAIKNNKDCTLQLDQLKKDILQHEMKYEELLMNFDKLQSEKLALQQDFEKGLSDVKVVEANKMASEEKSVKLKQEIQKLEEENQCFRQEVNTVKTRMQEKCREIEDVQKTIEKKCEALQDEVTEKERQIKAVETKLCSLRKKCEKKLQTHEEYKKENKLLKKQIAKETAKSSRLKTMISQIKEESQNLQRLKDEDCEKLMKDLESKSTSASELENEVQKLRLTAAEAVKNKEDEELKCQHKIADMVALMEKHKSQYDRMVEEKDADLIESKKKEMEAAAHAKSLELNLSRQQTENDELRQQLKTEKTEKETLQKEVADLKREITTASITQSLKPWNKLSPGLNNKFGNGLDTPQKSLLKLYEFEFPKTWKTPSTCSKNESLAFPEKAVSATNSTSTPYRTTQNTQHKLKEDMKTPGTEAKKISASTKIKAYRIRTPPSTGKSGQGKSIIELESKSDSSDHIDLTNCFETPAPTRSIQRSQLNILKKIQSPVNLKSPGSSTKIAALKRIRDAGWTAVTGCDKKKKKKASDRIFA